MSRKRLIATLLFLSVLAACGERDGTNKEAQTPMPARKARFEKLDAERTGLEFANRITEQPGLNYFDYGYMYNGAGVAVADFNGDSLPDLYFNATMGSNRLYLNQGDLRFEDHTEAAGVEATTSSATTSPRASPTAQRPVPADPTRALGGGGDRDDPKRRPTRPRRRSGPR